MGNIHMPIVSYFHFNMPPEEYFSAMLPPTVPAGKLRFRTAVCCDMAAVCLLTVERVPGRRICFGAAQSCRNALFG